MVYLLLRCDVIYNADNKLFVEQRERVEKEERKKFHQYSLGVARPGLIFGVPRVVSSQISKIEKISWSHDILHVIMFENVM